ncbi:MAG: XTP/dITP diphosphatase [Aerococcaceae bacterium]|nr:XTP/dITP diphosphatase [Aerococcaceae bacterium]
MKLIIASQNKGKIREFTRLLTPLGIEITSLLDYPELPDVEETGTTFEENARLKAETIANLTGCLVLSDDSGLVVPALGGAPGVYSARYAGEPKDDKANIVKLLHELENQSDRQAYFVSCLVVAHPTQESLVVEGRAYGEIAQQPSGEDGFGYDPVFYVASEDATFAQVSIERKNQISHRANALALLLQKLPEWLKGLA